MRKLPGQCLCHSRMCTPCRGFPCLNNVNNICTVSLNLHSIYLTIKFLFTVLYAGKDRLLSKGEVGFLSLFGACALIISIAMIVVGAIHAAPLHKPAQESGSAEAWVISRWLRVRFLRIHLVMT